RRRRSRVRREAPRGGARHRPGAPPHARRPGRVSAAAPAPDPYPSVGQGHPAWLPRRLLRLAAPRDLFRGRSPLGLRPGPLRLSHRTALILTDAIFFAHRALLRVERGFHVHSPFQSGRDELRLQQPAQAGALTSIGSVTTKVEPLPGPAL